MDVITRVAFRQRRSCKIIVEMQAESSLDAVGVLAYQLDVGDAPDTRTIGNCIILTTQLGTLEFGDAFE